MLLYLQDQPLELPLPKPIEVNSKFATKLNESLFEEKAPSPKPSDFKKNGLVALLKDHSHIKTKNPLRGSEAIHDNHNRVHEDQGGDDYFDDDCSNSSRLVVAEVEDGEDSQGDGEFENGERKTVLHDVVENGETGKHFSHGLDMSKKRGERQHQMHEDDEEDDRLDIKHEM